MAESMPEVAAMDCETNDSNDNPVRESIYSLVAGDTYDGLKRTFLASGKGRRPDPPTVPMTKKLLLMLHCLRLEGNCTLKDMGSWFAKLVPTCCLSADRLAKRIERTVSSALALLGTTALLDFANEPININSISPALDSIGLDRATIFADKLWPVSSKLTNEMVIDLEYFQSREKLPAKTLWQWVLQLSSYALEDRSVALCKKQLEKLQCAVKAMRKNKSVGCLCDNCGYLSS